MIIYKITNLNNGKIYIGKTTNIKNRWYKHCHNAAKGVTTYLYTAIRKHGKKAFKIEILEECGEIISDDRERYWIKEFDSNNHEIGYNMTEGGDGGNTHRFLSNEHREEIRRKNSEFMKEYRITHKVIITE